MSFFSKERFLSTVPAITKAAKRFLYLLVPFFIWSLLGHFGLLSKYAYQAGIVLLSGVFFVFGIPLSFVFGVDKISESFGLENNLLALTVAAVVTLLNFAMIAFVFSFFKYRKKEEKGND